MHYHTHHTIPYHAIPYPTIPWDTTCNNVSEKSDVLGNTSLTGFSFCLSFIKFLQPMCWHFTFLLMSSLYLLYQCFLHEFRIIALGSVLRNTVPWAIFPNTRQYTREQRVIERSKLDATSSKSTSSQSSVYVPQSTLKYLEVPRSTSKYLDIHRST